MNFFCNCIVGGGEIRTLDVSVAVGNIRKCQLSYKSLCTILELSTLTYLVATQLIGI